MPPVPRSPRHAPEHSELRVFVAWALIGLVNASIHLAVVVGLVEGLRTNPVLANGCAFIVANLFSFWANSRWAFRARATGGHFLRFFTVSLVGLAAALGASALAAALGWNYLFGVAITFIVLPVMTFSAHRFWTWGGAPP
ncbi:MAG: GtrA family protein [Pseudomonadota bacterium]|nr:GtrA family protein [Pseudomonadota bacterium]